MRERCYQIQPRWGRFGNESDGSGGAESRCGSGSDGAAAHSDLPARDRRAAAALRAVAVAAFPGERRRQPDQGRPCRGSRSGAAASASSRQPPGDAVLALIQGEQRRAVVPRRRPWGTTEATPRRRRAVGLASCAGPGIHDLGIPVAMMSLKQWRQVLRGSTEYTRAGNLFDDMHLSLLHECVKD